MQTCKRFKRCKRFKEFSIGKADRVWSVCNVCTSNSYVWFSVQWVCLFWEGRKWNRVKCKLANASKSLAKGRQVGWGNFSFAFWILPLDDSANLLLIIFDYKLTTLFISGTYFCEEPDFLDRTHVFKVIQIVIKKSSLTLVDGHLHPAKFLRNLKYLIFSFWGFWEIWGNDGRLKWGVGRRNQ